MSTFIASPDKASLKMAANTYPDPSEVDRIPVVYGYVGIAMSITLFQCLNFAVSAYGCPKHVSPKVPFFRWRNLVISWTHALIVGTWDLLCFWQYPEMKEDLIEHYNWFTYSMVAFSTGYFIYDFLDLFREGRLFSSWEIVLHHWAVTSMFFYDVITCRCIAYNVVALLAEVNSFFLHSRKLLQMSDVDYSSQLYKTVCGMNLLSFVPCRFGPVCAIFYGMLIWRDRVSERYFNFLAIATLLMFLINCFLFWRLLKSDVLRPFFAQKKKKPVHANNNVKENPHLNNSTTENNHANGDTIKSKTN